MTEVDDDRVTDVVDKTEEVCDGDGPLAVAVILPELVKEVDTVDVPDGEREGDLLLETVGRNVLVRDDDAVVLELIDEVTELDGEVLPLEE